MGDDGQARPVLAMMMSLAVSEFLTATCTPAIARPDLSLTLPEIVPPATCLGTSGFGEHTAPVLEAQRQEATKTRTPGWLARLIRVHHLAGKRLGSEVPADPVISIGGRSHDQREVLQLPLQDRDGAA
jgi:hypothetical protein